MGELHIGHLGTIRRPTCVVNHVSMHCWPKEWSHDKVTLSNFVWSSKQMEQNKVVCNSSSGMVMALARGFVGDSASSKAKLWKYRAKSSFSSAGESVSSSFDSKVDMNMWSIRCSNRCRTFTKCCPIAATVPLSRRRCRWTVDKCCSMCPISCNWDSMARRCMVKNSRITWVLYMIMVVEIHVIWQQLLQKRRSLTGRKKRGLYRNGVFPAFFSAAFPRFLCFRRFPENKGVFLVLYTPSRIENARTIAKSVSWNRTLFLLWVYQQVNQEPLFSTGYISFKLLDSILFIWVNYFQKCKTWSNHC